MADPDWFVIISDEIRGPFTAEQMRTAAQKGLVLPETQVRKGATADWFRADQIQGLLPPVAPAGPPSLEPEPAAPQPTPAPVSPPRRAQNPDALPAADTPLVKTTDRNSTVMRRSGQRKRRRSSPWPVLAAAVAGFALLMGMLYWLSLPGKGKPASTQEKTVEQASPR